MTPIKTYVRLTFFDCFGIISTDGTSAIADTTGVCGGSSILLDSIGASTFGWSHVDCSGSFCVSHVGSLDDFCLEKQWKSYMRQNDLARNNHQNNKNDIFFKYMNNVKNGEMNEWFNTYLLNLLLILNWGLWWRWCFDFQRRWMRIRTRTFWIGNFIYLDFFTWIRIYNLNSFRRPLLYLFCRLNKSNQSIIIFWTKFFFLNK